jgi:hypothetical protein
MPNSIGVPKMPGAMVMLRTPLRARSRAIARSAAWQSFPFWWP